VAVALAVRAAVPVPVRGHVHVRAVLLGQVVAGVRVQLLRAGEIPSACTSLQRAVPYLHKAEHGRAKRDGIAVVRVENVEHALAERAREAAALHAHVVAARSVHLRELGAVPLRACYAVAVAVHVRRGERERASAIAV
jgi:hypothetical protein